MNEFPTMTSETLRPAEQPTLYFIGVSTGRSSIQKVFPRWAETLGLKDVRLQGIDLPIHASTETYRRTVEFIAADPLSMGALVTTHKIDLYRAASDLFVEKDAFSSMMGETSCLSKSDAGLVCHAKDPISSGLALDAFIPAGHWEINQAELCCLGAGGSSIAISWYLSQKKRGADRPRKITITNRSRPRLDHIREFHETLDTDTEFAYALAPDPQRNDAIVRDMAEGSVVVNATGLGKDTPGSPLTDDVLFPEKGMAWDLNYRGELVFLDQARAQLGSRLQHVEDGWVYFLHGWTQVIGEVFGVDIPTNGRVFDALSDVARSTR